MKKLLLLILLTGIIRISSAQVNFRTEGMSVSEMLSNSEPIPDKLEEILYLDVRGFYDLKDQYDTELKLKYFKETEEFKNKYQELKQIKEKLMNTVSYILIDIGGSSNLSDYSLKTQTFYISIGEIFHNYPNERYPKTINNVYVDILGIEDKRIELVQQMYDQRFVVKMNEETAIKLENNKSETGLIYFIKPNRTQKVEYDKIDPLMQTYSKVSETLIIPEYIRIVLYNKADQDIYFDCVYATNEKNNLLNKDLEHIRLIEQNKFEEQKAQILAEKKRQEEIERQKKLKAEKELNDFLTIRNDKIFELKNINPTEYMDIEREINDYLIQSLKNSEKPTSFKLTVILTENLERVTNHEIIFSETPDNQINAKINEFVKKIQLPQSYMFTNYSIKTIASYNFDCDLSITNCNIKVSDRNELIDKNCEKVISEIKSKNYPNGRYSATYKNLKVNSYNNEDIQLNSFKGIGGSDNFIFSVFVPGLGNYFVNGGKGSIWGKNSSPLVTTIITLGFVSTGIYLKMESNKSYDSYHNATEQSEIDKFYNKANNQNKTAYILMGTGAVLWIYDIIWTAKTGAQNKKANETMKGKLSFAPVKLYNSKMGVGLTYNF